MGQQYSAYKFNIKKKKKAVVTGTKLSNKTTARSTALLEKQKLL
jgi:hypothetical protein